ncbi:MAG: hypothetical protein ABI383_13190 [Acidobacteriaceae bacterium]
MPEKTPKQKQAEHPDADVGKGAVESETPEGASDNSMGGQLPHRGNEDLNGADSDFPEPGAREEHSGE